MGKKARRRRGRATERPATIAVAPVVGVWERPNRRLPSSIRAQIGMAVGGLFALVGGIFLPVGVYGFRGEDDPTGMYIFSGLGGVLLIIGLSLGFYGVREVMQCRAVLRDGVPVWGMAVHVGADVSTAVNGRHPIELHYVYVDHTGETREGVWSTTDHKRLRALKLDALRVLYDPHAPDRSLLLDLI